MVYLLCKMVSLFWWIMCVCVQKLCLLFYNFSFFEQKNKKFLWMKYFLFISNIGEYVQFLELKKCSEQKKIQRIKMKFFLFFVYTFESILFWVNWHLKRGGSLPMIMILLEVYCWGIWYIIINSFNYLFFLYVWISRWIGNPNLGTVIFFLLFFNRSSLLNFNFLKKKQSFLKLSKEDKSSEHTDIEFPK